MQPTTPSTGRTDDQKPRYPATALEILMHKIKTLLKRDAEVIDAAPLHYGLRIDPPADEFDTWALPEKPDFVKEAMAGWHSIVVLTDKPE